MDSGLFCSPPPSGGGGSARISDTAPLPCLYSNNSIGLAQSTSPASSNESEKVQAISALTSLLSPYHKRAAQTLFLNVQRLITKEAPDVNHVGFLTLTFPDNVTDHKEAYRRFRSFNTNYLSKHPAFGEWVHVKERQKRGAWHYHLIIVLSGDIRSGINWEELSRGVYRSANPYLKALWKDLRENLHKYGLGRPELLPIRSNEEAMARYIGKYISKHMGQREEDDKGVRLVNYSRNWVKNSVNFAWNTKNAQEWRRKLEKFAKTLGCTELYQLSEKLGPGWVHKYLDDIIEIDQASFERGFNDHHEKRETIAPEFQSNTVKKINVTREKLELARKSQRFDESKWRSDEKKKNETKISMSKLKSEYVDGWLSDHYQEKTLFDTLRETKEESGRYHMKKNHCAIEKYHEEQTIFILKTGEVVPF